VVMHPIGPVVPSSAEKVRPQQVTHKAPLCGIFCLPWHTHSGTRNLGCLIQRTRESEVKWLPQGHKRDGLITSLSTTRSHRPFTQIRTMLEILHKNTEKYIYY
jgi:hypothetical protein